MNHLDVYGQCKWCGWPIETDSLEVEYVVMPSPNPKKPIVELHQRVCRDYDQFIHGLDNLIDDLSENLTYEEENK